MNQQKLPLLSNKFNVDRRVMDNQLTVLAVENRRDPGVCAFLLYNVGSGDEEVGRTGFAHLFEHLMFEGSANVKKNEFFQHVQHNGGRLNGFTSEDFTAYFEVMPANQLNLALWLEADRMRSLQVDDENVKNQKAVVIEEKSQRYDNQPYGNLIPTISSLIYQTFPYKHSTIGEVSDIQAASVADVHGFFDRYYVPANAVLAISGNLSCDEMHASANYYFGDINAGKRNGHNPNLEPSLAENLFHQYTDQHAQLPALGIAFKANRETDTSSLAAEFITRILASGESSRLHQKRF